MQTTRIDQALVRERWPWLLMAGPAIVVVAGFVTLYIAVSTDDGVIAEDYYKRGLLINRALARVPAPTRCVSVQSSVSVPTAPFAST